MHCSIDVTSVSMVTIVLNSSPAFVHSSCVIGKEHCPLIMHAPFWHCVTAEHDSEEVGVPP